MAFQFSRKSAAISAVAMCAFALTACSSSQPTQGRFQTVERSERPSLLVAMGMRAPEQPNIEYRPRSPLVLPGSTAGLQAPEEQAADPNFPVDPELTSVNEVEERDRRMLGDNRREEQVQAGAILRPDEVDTWERGLGNDRAAPPGIIDRILTPRELQEARLTEQQVELAAEPPRRRLSQPPEGYRVIQPDENGNLPQPSAETQTEEQPRRRWWPW